MKFSALLLAPIAFIGLSSFSLAEVPAAFQGLFEKEVPVRAQIGMVMPPPSIDKFMLKVEQAAQKNPKWFIEHSAKATPGLPLPYDENLGLTQKEYDEYIKLWDQREFKGSEDVALILRENSGGTWSFTATGNAAVLSTLRYDPKEDVFRSPNGDLSRLEDIDAEASSILGAWTDKEWKFEEKSSLGDTRENFAIGVMEGKKYGLVIHRVQEVSAQGKVLLDRSIVVRFVMGKAGQIKPVAEKK